MEKVKWFSYFKQICKKLKCFLLLSLYELLLFLLSLCKNLNWAHFDFTTDKTDEQLLMAVQILKGFTGQMGPEITQHKLCVKYVFKDDREAPQNWVAFDSSVQLLATFIPAKKPQKNQGKRSRWQWKHKNQHPAELKV